MCGWFTVYGLITHTNKASVFFSLAGGRFIWKPASLCWQRWHMWLEYFHLDVSTLCGPPSPCRITKKLTTYSQSSHKAVHSSQRLTDILKEFQRPFEGSRSYSNAIWRSWIIAHSAQYFVSHKLEMFWLLKVSKQFKFVHKMYTE